MRIGASITGFEQQLLTQLNRSRAAAAVNGLRLATGLKVNSPADDPSAFLNVTQLKQNRSNLLATRDNVTAAADFSSQTQLLIDQVRTEIDNIRTQLVADEDQTLTSAERSAAQSAIDTSLEKIQQLVQTRVKGRRPLDGSGDYGTSGVNSSQIRDVQVFAVRETTLSGTVDTAAQQATLVYGSAAITADATFTITGRRGAAEISVTTADSLSDVANRVNAESHETGIVADASGGQLILNTVEYGSRESIAITVSSGTFGVTGGNGDGTADGVDAQATINGLALTGDGNSFTFARNGLHLNIDFEAGFTGTFDSFSVSQDDVPQFALDADIGSRSALGLASLLPAQLGGLSGNLAELASGGGLDGLEFNTSQAIRVVDEALDKLTIVEGQVDGFAQATVATSASLLDALVTNADDALEQANAINSEEEQLLLAKNSGLISNTVSSLAILDQQRSSLVALVQQIAGLR